MTMRKTFLLLGAASLFACAAQAPALGDDIKECWKQYPPEIQIANCTKLIDKKPAANILADAFVHRASAYASKGMVKEALADYTRSLTVKHTNPQALAGRAQTYLTAREFDLAIVDYSAALKLDAKLATAFVGRGYAYLVKNDHDSAIRDFTSALAISPSYAAAYNNRGLAYKKAGKTKLAIADFTKAITVSPLYALAYANRGYTHEQTGDKAKAVEDFRNALAIDPSLTGARDGLVRLSAAGTIAAQSSERIADGRKLAQKNCAWCHAIGVKGKSRNKQAPRFVDMHGRHPILPLREPITRAIVTPHDAMPKLDLAPDQVDRLIAYINSLRDPK